MDHTSEYVKANEYSLKCMRVTLIVMTIAWTLNIFKIFIIDQNIMNHSFIGTIVFTACGYAVKYVLGFKKVAANYLMLLILVGMITFANVQLSYHGTLFMLFPMICAILYSDNRYITYTFILTCLGFLISVLGGFAVGLCDANMLILTTSTAQNETARLLSDSYSLNTDTVSLVLFYVVPRCMALVGFAAVLNYLKASIQEKTLREQESMQLAESEKLANQAKSHFLAQMSHEIRTPINAVMGMNEMILHKTRDVEILEYAGNIKKAGRSLLVLINSILDFSRIEDGKMELTPVKYRTEDMIGTLRMSVEQRAREKGLEFNTNVDMNLPCELYGDDMRISQVIINLLTNAVKYTSEGSVSLDIEEKLRSDDKITIQVKVSDTGMGIREEDLPRLFTSFERLDENKNRTIEGTGLGLSITTKLLEMMGSKLEVSSTYGEGSVFYFSLVQTIVDATPMNSTDKAPVIAEDSAPEMTSAFTASGARILVVDDNEMNIKVIRNLLGLFKIVPDTETSGRAAISRMREDEYDIVFMDHMMPEMDGIETLKVLREEKLLPEHTTVIALTANAIVGAREFYLDASFNDYLTKPVETEQLSLILDRYLPEDIKKAPEMEDTDDIDELGDDEVFEFSPSESDDEEDDDNDKKLIENAKSIGLSTEDGLRFCAHDTGFYKEMLADYASSHEQKAKTLRDCFVREDWKDYGIYVHALKSTSRSIGATDLSEQARMLEEAAANGNDVFIKQYHEYLLADYDALARSIGDIISRA